MTTMLERTRKLTESKREAVATELLAWPKIEDAIRLAAAGGSDRATITPAAPIKVRHTAAATDAVARLTKAGFSVRWADHRPTQAPAGDQLEIEW